MHNNRSHPSSVHSHKTSRGKQFDAYLNRDLAKQDKKQDKKFWRERQMMVDEVVVVGDNVVDVVSSGHAFGNDLLLPHLLLGFIVFLALIMG